MLAACGVAAASSLGAGSAPSEVTATSVTVPAETAVTITDPITTSTTRTVTLSAADALRLQAAMSDPAKIPTIVDARTRATLTAELRDLDSFLADRPKLRSYQLHIWYVAHHAKPPVYARRVAALLWCTVWFPRDCG